MRAPKWDNAVEATSDDAAISKLSSATLGYYKDPFLHHLVARPKFTRRSPLINRGYFARVAARDKVVHDFLQASRSSERNQIVALGAGSDTLFFRLKAESKQPTCFIEVDFPAVVERKTKIICNTRELNEMIKVDVEEVKENIGKLRNSKGNQVYLQSDEYSLFAADIRKTDELVDTLKSLSDFNFS